MPNQHQRTRTPTVVPQIAEHIGRLIVADAETQVVAA